MKRKGPSVFALTVFVCSVLSSTLASAQLEMNSESRFFGIFMNVTCLVSRAQFDFSCPKTRIAA